MSMTLFMLLMYIPLMYRTVYRIVFEKVTKAKESMRIMGMTDFPYWSSWFIYYTLVNTVLSVGAWLTLNINVFNNKSTLLLFIVIWVYG
jgi:arabinogalactan endo-1,4-beta-galactosidase